MPAAIHRVFVEASWRSSTAQASNKAATLSTLLLPGGAHNRPRRYSAFDSGGQDDGVKLSFDTFSRVHRRSMPPSRLGVHPLRYAHGNSV